MTLAEPEARPGAQPHVKEALRLTEHHVLVPLKNSPVVLYAQDLDLRYTWIHNPKRGMTHDQVVGKRDVDLMERRSDAEAIETFSREVLATGAGDRRDVVVQWHGVDQHYDLIIEPLRDVDGAVVGITCAAIDITARKRAEQAERERKETFRRDLALASIVQRGLVTRLTRNPGIKVYSHIDTAHLVGGDFYDLTPSRTDEMQVTCTIGDVVGKGVAASLMMVLALSVVRDLAGTTRSPSVLLQRANQRLRSHCSVQDPAMTAAVARIDLRRHVLRYARAGHEEPLLWRRKDGSMRRLTAPGTMLGVFDNVTYEDHAVHVASGDKLVLYTDGLTDARNATGEMFGAKRLEHLVAARGHLGASSLGSLLVRRVKQFRGPVAPNDDLALVIVEIE